MIREKRDIYEILGMTVFFHIVLFVCIYGVHCLDITYTDWMIDSGDLGLEFFGSLFFARSDWHFPIGLMEGLSSGLQSVVYFDALPILAMIGKVFRSILPGEFQLWGIYSLFAFCAQGSLGACCIHKFIPQKRTCIIGSLLFTFQLIFLSHIFVQIPLSSHWILLFAFLVALYYEQMKAVTRIYCVSGVLILTLFVQTAFLPMVLCILFFRILAEVIIKHKKVCVLQNIAVMAVGILCIILSAWLLGLFDVSTNFSGGSGR